MTLKNPVKPVNKAVLEKLGNSIIEEDFVATKDLPTSRSSKRNAPPPENEDEPAKKSSDRREKKKEKKSAADRREELLKQLKAVENAIAKKRTKIDSDRWSTFCFFFCRRLCAKPKTYLKLVFQEIKNEKQRAMFTLLMSLCVPDGNLIRIINLILKKLSSYK